MGAVGQPQACTLTTPKGRPSAGHSRRGEDQTCVQSMPTSPQEFTRQRQKVTVNMNPVPCLLRTFALLFPPQVGDVAASGQSSNPTEHGASPACDPSSHLHLQAIGCGWWPLCPVVPSIHSWGSETGHACSGHRWAVHKCTHLAWAAWRSCWATRQGSAGALVLLLAGKDPLPHQASSCPP